MSVNPTHLHATVIHFIVIILVDANYAPNLQTINATNNKNGMPTNVNVKSIHLQHVNLQLEVVKQKIGITKVVNANALLFTLHALQTQDTIRILAYAKNVQRLLHAHLDFKFGMIPHANVSVHQELLPVSMELNIMNLLVIVKNAIFQLRDAA